MYYKSCFFKFEDIVIKEAVVKNPKPAQNAKLVFGRKFSNHMLEILWSDAHGWGKPKIGPHHNLQLHPAAKVLHYALEVKSIYLHPRFLLAVLVFTLD